MACQLWPKAPCTALTTYPAPLFCLSTRDLSSKDQPQGDSFQVCGPV